MGEKKATFLVTVRFNEKMPAGEKQILRGEIMAKHIGESMWQEPLTIEIPIGAFSFHLDLSISDNQANKTNAKAERIKH